MIELHEVEGYIRCKDCGRTTPAPFALQTGRRCSDCWTGASPLLALEVMHRGQRKTIRISRNKEVKRPHVPGSRRHRQQQTDHNAQEAAWRRLASIFDDVYRVILDEERVKRGLHPIARYNPVDFERVVSETLDFHEVYDALRLSGDTDAQ